jgi:AcrR family transcriptional regulator
MCVKMTICHFDNGTIDSVPRYSRSGGERIDGDERIDRRYVAKLASVDFRTRTGQARRIRTRAKILSAAFDLFDSHGVDRVTVEDVREAAGLARGSFYNYFVTYEDMLKALAGEIGRQMVIEQGRFEGVTNTAERLWCNLRYAILRTASDRSCSEILARVTPLVGPLTETMQQGSEQGIRLSIRRKEINVPSSGVALDLGYGLATMMIRRVLRTGANSKELEAAGLMLLRAFGVRETEAKRISRLPLPVLPELSLRAAVIGNFGAA